MPEKKEAQKKTYSVDEFAKQVFMIFGFQDPLPEGLVQLYGRVKYLADSIAPRRMSAEMLALIAVIAVDQMRSKGA